MLRLWTAFQARIIREEKGASMVEYALLVALIAIVAIAAIALIGDRLTTSFEDIGRELDPATRTPVPVP